MKDPNEKKIQLFFHLVNEEFFILAEWMTVYHQRPRSYRRTGCEHTLI